MFICECLPDSLQILSLMIGLNFHFPTLYLFGSSVPWYLRYPTYTFWITLYPAICVADEFHIVAHEKRDGYRRTEALPKSIHPRWKKRKEIKGNDKRGKQYKKSGLLRLPREVRDMIWREVLGGCTINLEIRNRKLVGTTIASPTTSPNHQSPPSRSKHELTSIVRTCSQMYAPSSSIYLIPNYKSQIRKFSFKTQPSNTKPDTTKHSTSSTPSPISPPLLHRR